MAVKEIWSMTDKIPPAQRSANMKAVRSTNTGPELRVRRIAHSLGYRFRLHRRDLPGKPDMVFPSRRKAIFIHGCFWHRHNRCDRATMPTSNSAFWRAKFDRNVARDTEQISALKRLGWRVLVVWECETKDVPGLILKLRRFLK